METIRQVTETTTPYINAGGAGTRLSGIIAGHPTLGVNKALLEVGRPPIKLVDHMLRSLRWAGFEEVVVAAGAQSDIEPYIAANYSNRHVKTVAFDAVHGNGGDLLKTVRQYPDLLRDKIYVQNVDTILDIDASAFINTHDRLRETLAQDATIALTTRQGVPNEGAFEVENTGRVRYSRESGVTAPAPYTPTAYNASSTGAIVFEKQFLEGYEWDGSSEVSIYGSMLGKALGIGSLAGYNNGSRFFIDIGTPETYALAQSGDETFQANLTYAERLSSS